MVKVRCPYCGAEFEAPEGVTHAVCPYCGTVVELETGRKAKTFIYPARLEEQEAFAYALERLDTLPGAPRDLGKTAGYKRGDLHMIPLYVVRVRVWAEGCEAAQEEVEEVVRAGGAPRDFPGDYSFPVVGRVPYQPGMVKRAVFHAIRLPAGAAAEKALEATKRLVGMVFSEARAMCESYGDVHSRADVLGVAYYPVWELVYTYGGSDYRLLVDSVDPRILYAEYPADRSRASRLLAGYAGGAGVVTLAALAHGGVVFLAAAAGGLIGALIAALELLLRGRRVYRGERPWKTRPAYGVFTRTS